MATLTELREKAAQKSKELHSIFEQAGPDYDMGKVTTLEGDGAAKAAEIKRRNTELGEIQKEIEPLAEMEATAQKARGMHEQYNKPVGGMTFPGKSSGSDQQPEIKGLLQILRESREYQAFREGASKSAVIELPVSGAAELKTLMTLTTINNVGTRLPGIQESAQEERTVADLMLDGNTDNNTITYMEETTFTNAAAEVAEAGTKPESALAFTERTENVRKIATWIPATSELLADVRGIESYIRGRLMFMVKRREETQLLVGDGTAPNISGILDRSGIQTQAKGADPVPDAVYKAMTKIRNTGFAEPTAAVFHPNDWEPIRLLRTADGLYIWGHPSEVGPERIWGLPVRITSALTENTGLVGAFRPFAQIFRREGITITLSTEHSTFFVENKVAILAEERLALAVYRPAAFCTVTGI